MASLNVLSLQYVRVPVSATKSGAAYDPTSDDVDFAFLPSGQAPSGGDWTAGLWETDGSVYYAKILVGPGGTVTLSTSEYVVWVKIVDSPEIPVLQAGTLTIASV